ncbi:MAG: RNA methyltransferase [Candidatus Coatesbacteria bacterium]
MARELGGAHGRKKRGLVLLEGLRAVEAAIAAGGEAVLVTPKILAGPRGREVVAACTAHGVPVYEVDEALFRAVSIVEAPQGIALLAPPPRAGLAAALGGAFVLVADRIQDPGNLGALFRSARAFGVDAVVTTAGTVEAANPKAARAAAGAWPGLPVCEGVAAAPLARELGQGGRRVLVADAGGARDFREPLWRGRVALVLGNEGAGADPGFAAAGAIRVRIPLAASVESLNVTAAAAILLAEAARQRGGHSGNIR